jgi:hypothetical protein
MELSKQEKIELNKILESFQGRLDKNLMRLVMDLVFKTRVSVKKEDERLFSLNLDKIPEKSIESFSTGSFFGQAFQIGTELARRMELKLDANQKRLLREFVFFLVLFKYEKESSK